MGRGSSKAGAKATTGGIKAITKPVEPEKPKTKQEQFNDYRFSGLDWWDASNNYYAMKTTNADETKIALFVAGEHFHQTPYGYALQLDDSHVVYLKDWQVSSHTKTSKDRTVVLTKEFFNPKETKYRDSNFASDSNALTWDFWVNAAKAQGDNVMFRKSGSEKMLQSFQRQRDNKKKKG